MEATNITHTEDLIKPIENEVKDGIAKRRPLKEWKPTKAMIYVLREALDYQGGTSPTAWVRKACEKWNKEHENEPELQWDEERIRKRYYIWGKSKKFLTWWDRSCKAGILRWEFILDKNMFRNAETDSRFAEMVQTKYFGYARRTDNKDTIIDANALIAKLEPPRDEVN